MKLCYYISLLFIIPFLFGCSYFNSKPEDYEKIADRITEKTAEKLQDEKGLMLVGTGGRMMNDIKMMAMSFYFYQEVDLKTARELIVYAIKEYLSAINGSKEIRPYLHEYPFTAKNIGLRIWIFQPNGAYPPLDKIHYISATDGNLTYYLDLPQTYSLQAIYKETYEEALQR